MLVLAGPVGLSHHDGGPRHPEQPARLRAVMDGVDALHLGDGLAQLEAREATMEELARVHTPDYLRQVRMLCEQGGGNIDPDTYVRSDSWDTACRAAGAGLQALDELEQRGDDGVAFIPVRPPGHHATATSAMGFCLINNVAVAAASRAARGDRVLVIDWDVHHGNGTQDIFWDDPDVLYVSTHQHPLYPGTGSAGEVGGAGAPGLTVNLPVPPGATGDVLREAFDGEARGVVEDFEPDWVLVSCGFDAHHADPLSNLELSSGDYAELACIVREFAPPGRLALFLEGGYDLAALESSVSATLGSLLDITVDAERPTMGGPGVRALRDGRRDRLRAIEQAHAAER